MSVLEWIKSDATNKSSFVEKSKSGEYAEKLSKYANLFEEQAVQEFVKLGEEQNAFTNQRTHANGEELAQLTAKDVVGIV